MDDQSVTEVDQGEALPDDSQQVVDTSIIGDTDTAQTPEQQPAEDDSEDVDYEGEKYRVPKALKDALMRNADYTRKTQEVAEQRRALEQQHHEFQQVRALQQQNLQAYAQLAAIDGQIQQFAKLDFQALNQSDPVKAQELFFQFSQLKDLRQGVAANLSQSEAQALEMQRASRAKQIEEIRAVVAREIKDWSPEKDRALHEYAIKSGIPADVIQNVPGAWFVRLLNSALEFDQLQAKASKAPAKTPTVAKPVTQLPAGKNTVQKDPSQMSDTEFASWRKRQIAQRR